MLPCENAPCDRQTQDLRLARKGNFGSAVWRLRRAPSARSTVGFEHENLEQGGLRRHGHARPASPRAPSAIAQEEPSGGHGEIMLPEKLDDLEQDTEYADSSQALNPQGTLPDIPLPPENLSKALTCASVDAGMAFAAELFLHQKHIDWMEHYDADETGGIPATWEGVRSPIVESILSAQQPEDGDADEEAEDAPCARSNENASGGLNPDARDPARRPCLMTCPRRNGCWPTEAMTPNGFAMRSSKRASSPAFRDENLALCRSNTISVDTSAPTALRSCLAA